jgi:hypothetical protein
MELKRLVVVVLLVSFLFGCGTTVKYVTVKEPIGPLPKAPQVVLMDNGKHDKAKFPGTDWVKEPTVDLKGRRAYWDFDDIEKISNALTKWPSWGKEVEKLVDLHDKSISTQQGNASENKTRSWFRFWK